MTQRLSNGNFKTVRDLSWVLSQTFLFVLDCVWGCVCLFWPLSHSETPKCAPVASRARWSGADMLTGISRTRVRACKHTRAAIIQLESCVTHTYPQTSTEIWKSWLGSAPLMHTLRSTSTQQKEPLSHIPTVLTPSLQVCPSFAIPRIWCALPP